MKGKPEALQITAPTWLARFETPRHTAEAGILHRSWRRTLAFEIGELSVVLFVSAWLGLAYLKLGRRDEARHVLERGLRWGETRPAVTRADDRVEGRRLIERARAIFDEIGAPGWSSEAEAALNPAA